MDPANVQTTAATKSRARLGTAGFKMVRIFTLVEINPEQKTQSHLEPMGLILGMNVQMKRKIANLRLSETNLFLIHQTVFNILLVTKSTSIQQLS